MENRSFGSMQKMVEKLQFPTDKISLEACLSVGILGFLYISPQILANVTHIYHTCKNEYCNQPFGLFFASRAGRVHRIFSLMLLKTRNS
jgi:hypothetical protein